MAAPRCAFVLPWVTNMDELNPASQKRERHWLRALRPLLWWSILVLCLFAYHTHERLSERTRLKFTVDLEGKLVGYEASATLDGRPVVSGARVALGNHRFQISHPKAELVSSNFFVWYGEWDLGAINLKRTRGVLALEVKPPAAKLSVVGSEFSVKLTNSAGFTSSVPTGVYRVEANWANYDDNKEVTVSAGSGGALRLAPPLGAVTVESDPSGATVVGSNGGKLGTTPLTVPELRPGMWKGEIRLDGYIPVPVSLEVTASETNSFRTNLVNWQYSQAMESARAFFAAGDGERTLDALSSALKARPDDPDAMALKEKAETLQQESTVAKHLRQADEMLATKDYSGVRTEAEAVLKLVPGNDRALALINELARREQEDKQREQEQAEAWRQERLALPKKTFDFALGQTAEAPLFETHELQAALPVTQVQTALVRELETAPAFQVVRINGTAPEAFALSARQEVPGGSRACVIAGAQTGDGETRIFFKVMEYKKKTSVSFQGQLTFNTSYVPIDPSKANDLTEKQKAQLSQGATMVEERVRRAVGQKPQ